MSIAYYIRFYGAYGKLHGFPFVDASAMRRASTSPLPERRTTVEVARENSLCVVRKHG